PGKVSNPAKQKQPWKKWWRFLMADRAKVKICGITTLDDGRYAASLGADFLGFNFYPPSPRYIAPQKAHTIIANLPADVAAVGLFVNASLEDIRQTLEVCPLPWVQLHGDEDADFCRHVSYLDVKVIKALRIRSVDDMAQTTIYDTDALLLDAYHPNLYGGTGECFDWSLLNQLHKQNIFLAGGITPDNVQDALATGVWAIDICSGVEARPGVKDHVKLTQLFARINTYYGIQ
ncbi:MAG: phosphoribosylanthranilate isomerase, partial [Sedimentisphaerales bacterium]|nr:phosphoribosylanthranilate isomerase [Sedimentisphaerales bacterium]